jgi:hypothetical protein
MTKSALNPQGEQMADESMIRTLAAQIEAIWPQEKRCKLYRLPRNARVDVGAGTGEFSACRRTPPERVWCWAAGGVVGIGAPYRTAPRLKFEAGDAFHLRSRRHL